MHVENPDNWGRGEPKPSNTMPAFAVHDDALVNLLPVWAPDPAIRKKILADNPGRLYGI